MGTAVLDRDSIDTQKTVGRLSARAMIDEEFKRRLVNDPATTLAEHGLEIPADFRVEVVTSNEEIPLDHGPNEIYLVIPDAHDLSEEDLTMALGAAGSCQSTASSFCTLSITCISSSSTASTNSCQ